jgi:AraC-like DNA-binding protein
LGNQRIIRCEFSQINPFVRYVQRFKVTKDAYPSYLHVQACDCRLFYAYEGSGTIILNRISYQVSRGTFLLWKSGVPYHMSSNDNDTLILLGCNFDFTQNHSSLKHPIPPVRVQNFDPKDILENIILTNNPAFNEIVVLNNMFFAESILLDMYNEFKAQKIFCQKRLNSMLLSLLCLVYRSVSLGNEGSSKAISTTRIDEVISYIQEHYAGNLTNKSIAKQFNYHPNYLSKQILSYTGKSLYQYLISYRIARAIDILTTTNVPIAEIAEMVGFANPSHFCKTFRQKTGVTPSSLRTREAPADTSIDDEIDQIKQPSATKPKG